MDVEGFEVEGEFAAGDLGEIEEVVDEAGFEIDVAAEHADVVADGFGEVFAGFPDVKCGGDGGEGGSEFVAEVGEELVLGAVGGFGFGLGEEEAAFGVFVVGEIAEDEDDAVDISVLIADGGAAVVDGDFGAVLADEEGVVGEADGDSGAEYFFDGALDGVAGVLVDDFEDVGDGFAAGFGEGPAGEGFGDGVHEGDVGVDVGDHDGVADAGEGDGEEVFLAACFGGVSGAAFHFGDDAEVGPDAEEEFSAGADEEDGGALMFRRCWRTLKVLEVGLFPGDDGGGELPDLVHGAFADVGFDHGLGGGEPDFGGGG